MLRTNAHEHTGALSRVVPISLFYNLHCSFLCPVPGKLDKMGKIVGLNPTFKKMTKIKTFTADSGAFAELGPAGIGKPFFISKKPASLCQ